MTRKAIRLWRPVNATPRRGNGGGYAHSRSLSPRSRGRQTPPLPESSSRHPHYKPALVFALTSCVGHTVRVQTRNGETFEGILHTPGLLQGEVHFVLKKARKINKEEAVEGEFIERLVISSSDVVQLMAKELPIHPRTPRRPSQSPVLVFPMASDSENVVIQFGDFEDIGFLGDHNRIRDGAGLFGRELKKWEPEEGTTATDLDDVEHEVGTWDQFEENERKFGIKSDFNMDLYTTRLEPEKSKYTVAQAEKLAREIQSASSPNLHLQDERGQLTLDDSGVTEEVLYSSVLTKAPDQDKMTTPSPKAKKSGEARIARLSKSPEPMRASGPMILNQATQPLIIPQRRPIQNRKEVDRFVKDIPSAALMPQGSPPPPAILLNHPRLQPLNLVHGTKHKTLKGQDKDNFIRLKAEKSEQEIRNSREATIAEWREFSATLSISKLKPPQNHPKSPIQPSGSAATDDAGQSSVRHDSGSIDLASQDAAMQRELTPLKIEPNNVDEELGEGDSGPGLNPHARPFNPGQYTGNDSAPTAPSGSEGSCIDLKPSSTRADTPIDKSDEDLLPRQPTPTQPPIPSSSQPMRLIRPQPPQPPQPPPPPPRVVTPPPPPTVQEMPQPMMIPMIRPPHRSSRGSSSPAGRRTPHQHMQETQMIMNNPPMLMHSDSGQGQGSGPPMHSNGQPPQMVPMMPTLSGPMPMMPQQMQYPYPEGRVPLFFPFHGPVPHVQPQGPPGQNPPQEQMPQMVYPAYYPAPMTQYPMTYPHHMIPPGLPQPYMSVAHTPMTPRPAQQRPRPNRRKSFLNYGPRRG